MTLNNTLAKLQVANSGVVELEATTKALRTSGDIAHDATVLVRIRKVRAAEIVASTGSTPLMLSVLKERRADETPDEFRERLSQRISDDPQAIQESQQMILATQEAVVIHGVTAIAITEAGTRPEWDPVKLERTGERTIDLLGDDLHLVHDKIVDFSGLPYQHLGGAGAASFPAGPDGAGGEPSGGVLRDDPEPIPEPPAG